MQSSRNLFKVKSNFIGQVHYFVRELWIILFVHIPNSLKVVMILHHHLIDGYMLFAHTLGELLFHQGISTKSAQSGSRLLRFYCKQSLLVDGTSKFYNGSFHSLKTLRPSGAKQDLWPQAHILLCFALCHFTLFTIQSLRS